MCIMCTYANSCAPYTCIHTKMPEEGIQLPDVRMMGSYELPDVGSGH